MFFFFFFLQAHCARGLARKQRRRTDLCPAKTCCCHSPLIYPLIFFLVAPSIYSPYLSFPTKTKIAVKERKKKKERERERGICATEVDHEMYAVLCRGRYDGTQGRFGIT